MTPADYVKHPALCALPWIGVYVNPDGKVKNCAISALELGDLHADPVEKILAGPNNVMVKQDMLAKIRHSRCNACYSVEDTTKNKTQHFNSSNRSWYKKYGIKNVNLDLYDHAENFDLRVLDLRWRNTCNFSCVYCGPDLSSQWASELKDKSFTIDEDVLGKNKKYIFENLSLITHVYLAGGEPLLIKENLELLNILKEQNPDVEIRINTNLSIIDNEIFKKLITFKNVKWTVSVDATGAEFEYIRYPGNWNKFYHNLLYLKQQEFDINFNMVWCVLNSTSILDCVDFLKSIGFHENSFIIQNLTSPVALDPRSLPAVELDRLKEKIKAMMTTSDPQYWLYKSLNSMYNFVNIPSPNTDMNNTLDFLNTLDKRRNLSSRDIFPMLYTL
jgi:MoaA/NifB/PqqE/SkfB family radical SAM enzyme